MHLATTVIDLTISGIGGPPGLIRDLLSQQSIILRYILFDSREIHGYIFQTMISWVIIYFRRTIGPMRSPSRFLVRVSDCRSDSSQHIEGNNIYRVLCGSCFYLVTILVVESCVRVSAHHCMKHSSYEVIRGFYGVFNIMPSTGYSFEEFFAPFEC